MLLNNGSGYFTRSSSGDPSCPGFIFDFHVFDIDLDGDVDLINDRRNYPNRRINLNLNDGTGHFVLVDGLARGLPEDPGGVAVLDIDVDGDVDVARPDAVYLNDGSGFFQRGNPGDCLNLSGWQQMVVLDASLDGIPDLLLAPALDQRPETLCVSRGLYPDGTVTTDRIFPDRLYPGTGRVEQYQTLDVEQLTPGDSAITYDVLDGLSNQPIPGYYHVLPDPAGQIDLRSIDAATYPIVRLRAKLIQGGGGETPQLRRWKLTFQMQFEPTSVGLESFDTVAVPGEAVDLIWVVVGSAGMVAVLGWRARRSRPRRTF